MKHLGHPVLGDSLYAPPDIQASSPRLCLHAQFIKFKHPVTKEEIIVNSRKCDFLPDDFVIS